MSSRAWVLTGLGCDDEAKGRWTDFICAEYGADLVVRHNGGPNASHNVVTPMGRHHAFSQIGSGTLVGARTHLGFGFRLDPFALLQEVNDLAAIGETDVLDRLTIDARAHVITPYDVAWNQYWSSQEDNRFCSSGTGYGSVTDYQPKSGHDSIEVGALRQPGYARERLLEMRNYYMNFFQGDIFSDDSLEEILEFMSSFVKKVTITNTESWHELRDSAHGIVFEGGGGVLLDYRHGMDPGKSSGTCTSEYVNHMIDGFAGSITRIGCSRIYSTRHGAGVLATEDEKFKALPEPHNPENPFQGPFRAGWFEMSPFCHACRVIKPLNEIFLSHADYWDLLPDWNFCYGITRGGLNLARLSSVDELCQHIYRESGVRVTMLGMGPTRNQTKQIA